MALPPPSGVPGVNATIAFDIPGTLELAPGQLVPISVTAAPPQAYQVAFRLVGNSLDASLDLQSAVADAQGRASVTLRAPSQPATFAVRATIKQGPSADLVVSVSDMGFATVAIEPAYHGHRAVDEWVGSVAAGTTCQALAAMWPKDPEGALVKTAQVAAPLLVTDAPVGPALAVAVRASHFAWGCTDAGHLQPGTTSTVAVNVVDRPIDAANAALSLSLAFDPDPAAYQPIVAQHLGLITAVFGGQDGQPSALLGAMHAAAQSPQAFDAAAQKADWLGQLKQRWQDQKIDLAATLQNWAGAAPEKAPQFRGHLASLGEPGHALFSLAQIGPLSAADAGAPTDYLMTLGFDPDDSVHLGGTLYFLPSRYLGAQISLGAPQNQSVPDALAAAVGCAKLGWSMNGCDAGCIADLCHAGLSALWLQALDASANADLPAQIPMNASGAANYDDFADFTGFVGSWLGELQSGQLSAKISGPAVAMPDNGPSK